MYGFGKIRCNDGSFLADDIRLNREKTIKVYGENGTLMGLSFLVPGERTCISDQWKRGESQMGHFYIVSLQNGLKFPLLIFILEVLHHYGAAPSQLA